MDAPAPSPWHAPPPWLAAQLLATLLRSEPRWPLVVAELRLVSRGFRNAVGEALPGLALPRYLPASTAAAVAACFPGLRVLCLDTPAVDVTDHEASWQAQAAALASICANCTGLRRLILRGWFLPEGGLQPLASLSQLQALELRSVSVAAGAFGEATLPPLPLLRSLQAPCLQVGLDGVCQLMALTSLELPDAGRVPQLLQPLAQRLPHLQRLVLSDVSAEQCEQLPCLAALSTLTSLSLATSPDTGLPQPELLQLLAAGRLRCLELNADYSYDCHLPLARLSGLQSLTLDTAEIQLEPPSSVSCLARLTELELNVHTLLQQAETEEVGAFVGVIGRRLTGLRRLALAAARHLSEAAMQHISGLTALTELSITDAHDFGGRALEALRPLAMLRRLRLTEPSLDSAALGAVLDDEEGSGLPLLPALTYLELHNCRLLSAPDVARLATALPSLHQLRLTGWPPMGQPTLEHILMRSPSLQLLQTAWRPLAAPHISSGAEPDAQQLQDLQQHEQAEAFCRSWRLKLQHSMVWPADTDRVHFAEAVAEAARAALPP